ncbi:MAG TPA: twin-arginine translocase TatA/TatE family subunit [Rhizomicrobium sp.]|nr:twin-arginine translocase TatA/TatE family subunit [Rhizomicrobium sp.]
MGTFGIWHVLLFSLVALVLFGRGKVSDLMGDFGHGISSFKKALNEKEPPRVINADTAEEKQKIPNEP